MVSKSHRRRFQHHLGRNCFLLTCVGFLASSHPVCGEPFLLDNGEAQKQVPLPRTFDLSKLEPKWSAGKLDLKLNGAKELLPFGPDSELMGVGFIFHPESIPPTFQSKSGDYRLLQILFSKRGIQAPFASVLIQAENFKAKEQTFRVAISKEDPKKAWMMVSSPNIKETLSNEEKLKGTYFGSQGVVKLSFIDTPSQTIVKFGEKTLTFKIQKLKVTFNAILTTPFNPLAGDIGGTVSIPVLWAEEQASLDQLSQLLVAQSENEKVLTKEKQESIQNHKREISGSSREKK